MMKTSESSYLSTALREKIYLTRPLPRLSDARHRFLQPGRRYMALLDRADRFLVGLVVVYTCRRECRCLMLPEWYLVSRYNKSERFFHPLHSQASLAAGLAI